MASNIKQSIVGTLLLALVLGLMPVMAMAQSTDRPERGERDGDAGANFCENLDAAEERALASLGERKAKTDRSGDVDSKKSDRMSKLEDGRSERDGSRDTRYDELRDRATTDEQSAAIEDFIETVEALVADRKTAVDAAIEDFEAAVEDLLAQRADAVDDYAGDIEGDIAAIFDEAEDMCDDGDEGAAVLAYVKEAFMSLREAAKADRDEYSFKDELEEAREVRKAATEAARTTFKSAYEDAKEELKAALGVE